jgi:hypothetical protein
MSASPTAEAVPLVPEAVDPVSQSWMYRSEAFAEDLDESSARTPEAVESRARQALLRLGLPLSAVMLGVGMVLAYGLP